MQKKCRFFLQNFISFYRPPKFVFGNIFKYVKQTSAIFAENVENVGVCRFKKVRFSQPFGVKLKIGNKKKTISVFLYFISKMQ